MARTLASITKVRQGCVHHRTNQGMDFVFTFTILALMRLLSFACLLFHVRAARASLLA